jgi:hypothetical protein
VCAELVVKFGNAWWCETSVMKMFTARVVVVRLLSCASAWCTIGVAGFECQVQAAVPLVQRSVDLLAVADGPNYFGAVISPRNAAVVRIAVQREWFQQTLPDRYRDYERGERERQRRQSTQLTQRIKSWISDRQADEALTGFLRSELARLEDKQPQAGAGPGQEGAQFVVVSVARDEVRRVYRQPAQRKQFAMLAWRERIPGVEALSVDELRKELRKRGVAHDTKRVDLSNRLAAAAESPGQWAARVAIVEYQYRRRVDFQGMGSALVQTDGEAPALDVKSLVEQLVPGQLDLESLLGGIAAGGAKPRGGDGLQKASQSAARLGCRGFRVTRIGQDVLGGRARVTGQFVAQMPDGKWRVVWSETSTVSSNQVKAAQVDRVQQDPRVKQVFTLAKTLGLGGDQMQTALRFGAATMQAQQEIDGRFYEFRDRYISRLDQLSSP